MHLCSNKIGTPILNLTDSDTSGIDVIRIRIALIIVENILYRHFLKYRIGINIKLLVDALDIKKYMQKYICILSGQEAIPCINNEVSIWTRAAHLYRSGISHIGAALIQILYMQNIYSENH